MLHRLARRCYENRKRVLVVWIAILVVLVALAGTVKGKYAADARLPGTESTRAFDLLKAKFPSQGGDTGTIVFSSTKTIDDQSVRGVVDQADALAAKHDGIASIVSPLQPEGARQVSPDRTIAFTQVHFAGTRFGQWQTIAKDLKNEISPLRSDAVTIEFGGQMFADPPRPPSTEGLGILAAVVILLIAFGSVLAMGLPIIVALFGIGCGISSLVLLSHVITTPNFATQVAAMIGIGVGIDYALFIVTRYRTGLHDGLDPESAIIKALSTAGRAVLFAGTTVVISLLGMFLMGVRFVWGLCVGASISVLFTMVASVTLLPALLGFTGHAIDKLSVQRHHDAGTAAARRSFWYRWSRLIQRRPLPAMLAGLAVLIALAIPLFSIRLGSADAGNNPTSDTARRSYDLLSKGFGPGFNGPFIAVGKLDNGNLEPMNALAAAIRSQPDVSFVSQPQPNPAGDTAILQIYPSSSPQDEATTKLVHHLRHDVVPQALAGTNTTVYIGGITAAFTDFADKLGARLPVFMFAVLVFSFLLLMAVFRSVVVPLKAVVMNLLSIGAAYGAIVAVFQWGWLKDVIGIGKAGPIEAWAPMMLFAIVFGLSMDYEVFLLSRVREEYDRTGDNAVAVADGLASTARVITAAAAIMVVVFGSFVLGDIRQVKLIGLGLALAVLLDATVVRLVLVPATMELLGSANWWIPRWLDRLVPHVDVETDADVDAELAELAARQREREATSVGD